MKRGRSLDRARVIPVVQGECHCGNEAGKGRSGGRNNRILQFDSNFAATYFVQGVGQMAAVAAAALGAFPYCCSVAQSQHSGVVDPTWRFLNCRVTGSSSME